MHHCHKYVLYEHAMSNIMSLLKEPLVCCLLFFVRAAVNYLFKRFLCIYFQNLLKQFFTGKLLECTLLTGEGSSLPEKFGGGIWPASQNPYPIYDQNLWFSLLYIIMTWKKLDTLFVTFVADKDLMFEHRRPKLTFRESEELLYIYSRYGCASWNVTFHLTRC